jgi:hypothetical protein
MKWTDIRYMSSFNAIKYVQIDTVNQHETWG